MEPTGLVAAAEKSVEVVWRSCEHCGAMEPRYEVAIGYRHEDMLPLRNGCCSKGARSAFAQFVVHDSGYDAYGSLL